MAENAAWMHHAASGALADLTGYFTFAWSQMTGWYEEEEEIFVHARDPYKRVDVLPSARHVRVVIAGETVADTHQPFLLFETSLPTRYYLPTKDVRQEVLEPSDTTSQCPYKGRAAYWSVSIEDRVVKDVVWSYRDPIPECPKIRGLMCFFNERVDIYVDDELQMRPHSPWMGEYPDD